MIYHIWIDMWKDWYMSSAALMKYNPTVISQYVPTRLKFTTIYPYIFHESSVNNSLVSSSHSHTLIRMAIRWYLLNIFPGFHLFNQGLTPLEILIAHNRAQATLSKPKYIPTRFQFASYPLIPMNSPIILHENSPIIVPSSNHPWKFSLQWPQHMRVS